MLGAFFAAALGRHRLAGGQAHDGTVLRTLFTQQARELAGIDIGNRHSTLRVQELRQILLRTEIAGDERQVANDQARSLHLGRFHILLIDTIVTNVRIGQGDDLLAVARVCENFLVAGHGGVEHHFADSRADATNGIADKHRAVCERQNGWRESCLE